MGNKAVEESASARGVRKVVRARCVFFFQAEDGIRDLTVTGVQTCALPISKRRVLAGLRVHRRSLAPSRGAFRAGPRQRGARAERVLRGRLEEPQGPGDGGCGALVRGLPVRARAHQLRAAAYAAWWAIMMLRSRSGVSPATSP